MGLVNVDVDLLRTLVVVAELKTFTAAGERLHRTQSAISLQIKRLEQVVGERLVDRGSGKDVRLTKAGALIRSYALEILRLNDALVREVKGNDAPEVLRIGMPDDYAEVLLPKVIRELDRRNQNLELQIITDLSTRLGRRVEQGELDLAFLTRHEGIDGFKLLDEHLSWVSVEGASIMGSSPLPLALFPEGCGMRRNAIAALEAAGKAWQIAYCSQSFSTLKTAILERRAIGVLPTRAIPSNMIAVGDEWALPSLRSSELLVSVDPRATPAVLRLASYMLQAFEVELPRDALHGVPRQDHREKRGTAQTMLISS